MRTEPRFGGDIYSKGLASPEKAWIFADLPPPTKVPAGTLAFTEFGPVLCDGAAWVPTNSPTKAVAASRALTAADNGWTLEVTADAVTLTVPEALQAMFGCAVIPNGTTSIARSGTTLINGAGTTLTRAAASNSMVAIVARASAVNSYVVTGS